MDYVSRLLQSNETIDESWCETQGTHMARAQRFQYPGAVCQVMARGDGARRSLRTRTIARCCSNAWPKPAAVAGGGCMLGEVKRNPKLRKRFNELDSL